MLAFPRAKINLGLNVLSRRPDGFHAIESVFVPVPLNDALEVIIAPELGTNGLEYTRSGIPIPGDPIADLCYKAVRLLQRDRDLPGLRMHLHKVIPMGAGLGGGSSDGAHTLRLINTLCQLGLPYDELGRLALALGSDCPFFLQEHPCIVRGRGEVLSPVDLDLTGTWIVLMNPGIHVRTAEVFKHTIPTGTTWDIEGIIRNGPSASWHKELPNTMEAHVLEAHPMVGSLKGILLRMGAYYAAMSGSGSTVFGLFKEEPALPRLPAEVTAWKLRP
ncbi:MAG TPA: 4-(cytidine 5'-diphospho)-2-C-methyl-D-erythritol kinase [Flavobacteriales bacterium]|nr:4-(cytidine 5'-diphospho)-2-C-methyl-D-erythritol kinase [Flavobacteriales bacterium]